MEINYGPYKRNNLESKNMSKSEESLCPISELLTYWQGLDIGIWGTREIVNKFSFYICP